MRFKRIMLEKFGLKYCTGCRTWMEGGLVSLAKCRECENERYRNIYRNTKLGQLKRAATKARKRNITPLPAKIQKLLLEMFDGLCAYCGINEADTFDHIVPVSLGGKTIPHNVVPARFSCNSSKRDRDVYEWMSKKRFALREELENELIMGCI